MHRPASCLIKSAISGNKKPAQQLLKQVPLALAAFVARPQAEFKSAQKQI